MKENSTFSSLWKKEDWWAVWLGFIILAVASTPIVTKIPKINEWTSNPLDAISFSDAPLIITLGVCLLLLTAISIVVMEHKIKPYVVGFPLIFILAYISFLISKQEIIHDFGVEYVFWALILGLVISNVLRTPNWLKVALKTELFIKIGLVLLGAEILFHLILSAGAFGMLQAIIVVFVVWNLCYYLARKVGLSKSFASILASGVSICGVSAAIATGGAIKGKKEEITYTISLVLLIAMPMLMGMPVVARVIDMPEIVAGAWIGGTIDTTPAVVAAGALYSEKAMYAASIVKMSQNVLIGIVAFSLALYWIVKVERKPFEKPKPIEIWYRFPKFIIGFIVASIIFSLFLVPMLGESSVREILVVTKGIRGWFFSMAFICIGLNTRFKELIKIGKGKPLTVFLAAQIFNIILTLALAYLLFGGIFFQSPL